MFAYIFTNYFEIANVLSSRKARNNLRYAFSENLIGGQNFAFFDKGSCKKRDFYYWEHDPV